MRLRYFVVFFSLNSLSLRHRPRNRELRIPDIRGTSGDFSRQKDILAMFWTRTPDTNVWIAAAASLACAAFISRHCQRRAWCAPLKRLPPRSQSAFSGRWHGLLIATATRIPRACPSAPRTSHLEVDNSIKAPATLRSSPPLPARVLVEALRLRLRVGKALPGAPIAPDCCASS